jgi:hypothetical protein
MTSFALTVFVTKAAFETDAALSPKRRAERVCAAEKGSPITPVTNRTVLALPPKELLFYIHS